MKRYVKVNKTDACTCGHLRGEHGGRRWNGQACRVNGCECQWFIYPA